MIAFFARHLIGHTPDMPVSHDVARWHCSPSLALMESYDGVNEHSWRVANMAGNLCAVLGMDMSIDLAAACHSHDAPEQIMGDWPATLTRNYRVARWAKAILEWQIKREMGLKWKLTKQEALILSLCDTLDAVLWVRKHDPEFFAARFGYDVAKCKALAEKLGPKAVAWLGDMLREVTQ